MSKPIGLVHCTHCGNGDARRMSNDLGHYVECPKCGIRTRYWKRPGDAAKDWNNLMSPAKPSKPAKKPAKRPERQHGGGRR